MLTPAITEYEEVLSALMHHLATSVRKLRRQNSYARTMYVFFITSQHPDYKGPRLVRSREVHLRDLIRRCETALYREDVERSKKMEALQAVIDEINGDTLPTNVQPSLEPNSPPKTKFRSNGRG